MRTSRFFSSTLAVALFIIALVAVYGVGRGQSKIINNSEIREISEYYYDLSGNPFYHWREWPSSNAPKNGDYLYEMLFLLSVSSQKNNFIDINGDGLVDMLIGDYSSNLRFYAIYENLGNNNFEPIYKCAYNWDGNYDQTYYGDCADV